MPAYISIKKSSAINGRNLSKEPLNIAKFGAMSAETQYCSHEISQSFSLLKEKSIKNFFILA